MELGFNTIGNLRLNAKDRRIGSPDTSSQRTPYPSPVHNELLRSNVVRDGVERYPMAIRALGFVWGSSDVSHSRHDPYRIEDL